MTQDVTADASSPLSHLPLSLLHAEISRRQTSNDDDADSARPSCGSADRPRTYNTALHVFALFLILVLSTFACSFPLIVRRFPSLPVPNYSLFLSRHFGTGVLIATAFVHLLPTAYTNLTDACLPPFWNDVYPAMSGLIAMVSVLAVVGIEMGFAIKGAGSHSHGVDLEHLRVRQGMEGRASHESGHSLKSFRQVPFREEPEEEEISSPVGIRKSPYSDTPGSVDKPLPSPPAPRRNDDDDSDLDLDEIDPNSDNTQLLNGSPHPTRKASGNGRPRPARNVSFASPPASPTPPETPTTLDANEQRLVLQCLLLEAGILFHSVFIGMALSVSTGTPFIVLLIAIAFHQTFEGLALGSRIAGIPSFSTTSTKPWLMSALYGITTPIGQAIGLAVHTLYDPASQFGLLMVGIVNAISCGLLLYAGLVQLLAEDFLSDQSYRDLRGKKRLQACGAVVGGAMLMALVGVWA